MNIWTKLAMFSFFETERLYLRPFFFSDSQAFYEIASNPDVIARIEKEVEKINEKFGNWEKIKRFELTPDVWSIDGGHLTPTLKLKRKIVMEKYKDLYQKIYS